MKFFIKGKPKSTQSNRTVKRFLWLPTIVQQVNDTKEYRWLEWVDIYQNRYMGAAGWSDWKDRKYILYKENENNTKN